MLGVEGRRRCLSWTRPNRESPGCHLHDNAVVVLDLGGGLGDLGGGRHVDCWGGCLEKLKLFCVSVDVDGCVS